MNRQDNIITNIKPSTAIRHDYNAFSKLCHETQAPVVVTKNGKADLVVMSCETYQKMIARQRLGQMLTARSPLIRLCAILRTRLPQSKRE